MAAPRCPRRGDPPMKRHLNRKLLAYLLITPMILGVGSYALRAFQLKRTAAKLKARAERAREKGDARDVERWLGRYLAFAPHDADALARYGRALEDLSESSGSRVARRRAYSFYDRSLALAPERPDAQRRAADLAVR